MQGRVRAREARDADFGFPEIRERNGHQDGIAEANVVNFRWDQQLDFWMRIVASRIVHRWDAKQHTRHCEYRGATATPEVNSASIH